MNYILSSKQPSASTMVMASSSLFCACSNNDNGNGISVSFCACSKDTLFVKNNRVCHRTQVSLMSARGASKRGSSFTFVCPQDRANATKSKRIIVLTTMAKRGKSKKPQGNHNRNFLFVLEPHLTTTLQQHTVSVIMKTARNSTGNTRNGRTATSLLGHGPVQVRRKRTGQVARYE